MQRLTVVVVGGGCGVFSELWPRGMRCPPGSFLSPQTLQPDARRSYPTPSTRSTLPLPAQSRPGWRRLPELRRAVCGHEGGGHQVEEEEVGGHGDGVLREPWLECARRHSTT